MIAIGDRLDQKYIVMRTLGSGGFGQVYLANDEKIPGRQVAIKILSKPPQAEENALLREMRALAQFNHPHVVGFYHHFQDSNGLCLVMEYCAGGSLDDRLRANGPLPEGEAFAYGLDLCETLAFVHTRGIVHHDIKPLNILFAADGTIKLADFGMANLNGGTRIYMPLELLLGEFTTSTDPRTDVYSLGLTLLEAVIGQHPFVGLARVEAIQAAIAHDFVPDHLPRWVQELLLKATHPTPEMRFQTMADFGEAISGRHVSYEFRGDDIRADRLARKAEGAIARKKWKNAETLTASALRLSPDCVSALLAAGRWNLEIGRFERAKEYFTKAVEVSPRTPVQKELGWISLEQGHVPTAISLLTDHLHRNAADFEAYNLLLKCFYLTDRFEAGESLARTLMEVKAPNECFGNNRFLCRLFNARYGPGELERFASQGNENPFIAYNLKVATEQPRSWGKDKAPFLKSKLLFQEYQYGTPGRARKKSTLACYFPFERRWDFENPIVSIGSSAANDVRLNDVSVSRRHCAIVNYSNAVWLHDLGSSVGTFVEGERVSGRVLLDGVHTVTIGTVEVRIASSSDRLV